MSMRVATFAMTDGLVRSALKVQAQEAEATLQQASGSVSSDWAGYGSGAGRIVDLQVSIDRSTAYAAAATEADARVQQMYTSLGSMIDGMTSFKSDLVNFSATLTDSGTEVLAETASSMLDTLTSLLNTRFEGRYLFSGAATDTAPVDADAIVAQTAPSSADTTWYAGDDEIASVRVADDRTVDWGVTADGDGFEKALRALAMIAAGNVDDTSLEEASTLVAEALDAMTVTQSKLSLSAESLESAVADQEDYQSFASTLVTDATAVDVAEVAVRLANLQSQLEATFSAIGKVQSLSLVDYLS